MFQIRNIFYETIQNLSNYFLQISGDYLFLLAYLCNMENLIFRYTEFLLISHSCVIIPDLGAFIINNESTEYPEGEIRIPEYSVIFNQDLKHNDGLLCSFIRQQENISYEASCKKIKQAVLNIKSTLQKNSKIKCHNLGEFISNENHSISFIANNQYFHPSVFGLQPVLLKHVTEIDIEDKPEKRKTKRSYSIGRIASAAALILFFFAPSIDITDQGSRSGQQASFVHLLPNSTSTKVEDQAITNNTLVSDTTDKESEITSTEEENNIIQSEEKKVSLRTYYIILGSEKNESEAQILKSKIEADFPNVTLLKVKNRYRLYSVSFDEKPEAEKYLAKFRNDNPKYKTAWLYSKRNNS